MAGVPIDLNKKLKAILLKCDSFNGHNNLSRLFADERIYPWRNSVPETDDRQERVLAIINKLHDQRNKKEQNALTLFVEVLQDNTDSENAQYQELGELLTDLHAWGAKGSRGAFPPTGQPSQVVTPPVTPVEPADNKKTGYALVIKGGE